MKNVYLFMIASVALLSSGCATLLTGTTQKIAIDSYPQGAEIIVDGRSQGLTPAVVRLDKDLNAFLDGGKLINLELKGYSHEPYVIGTEFNPVAIINLANVLCWGVDAATGAVMRYEKRPTFELQPMPPSQTSDAKITNDKYKNIEELKRLLDQGAITQDEYNREKSKILNNGRVDIGN